MKAERAAPAPVSEARLVFLRQFVQRPDLVGSVVPSSVFLSRRIARFARVKESSVVVEFGPGTGTTTRAILAALPQDAVLIAIEINPEFVRLLLENPDPRLHVHLGSADDIGKILAFYGVTHADAVISGIPFSTMTMDLGRRIIAAISSCLAPGGRFVAYQFRGRVSELAREVFGPAEQEIEFRNIPPMRLYSWQKRQR